jgi:glycosyltransferase involved in cell wall biosynthesis
MDKPFFSIVLPTYNRVKFLPKAINSVLAQTYTNWELTIVDDGSTDGTRDFISTFNDNRIKYYYHKNQERSFSRNRGIECSSGTYICFLDSDDYYLEDHLQNLYNEISNKDFPVCFFYVLRCFESNGIITYPRVAESRTRNNIELIFNIMIATPQACIHKEIVIKYKFDPEFKTGEDLELWSRILTEYQLERINEYTVVSKIHNENSVNFASGNFFRENLRVVKYIFNNKNISSFISLRQKHLSISNCHFGIARYYLYKKKKAVAIFYLLRSIIEYPFHKQNIYRLKLIIKSIL